MQPLGDQSHTFIMFSIRDKRQRQGKRASRETSYVHGIPTERNDDGSIPSLTEITLKHSSEQNAQLFKAMQPLQNAAQPDS